FQSASPHAAAHLLRSDRCCTPLRFPLAHTRSTASLPPPAPATPASAPPPDCRPRSPAPACCASFPPRSSADSATSDAWASLSAGSTPVSPASIPPTLLPRASLPPALFSSPQTVAENSSASDPLRWKSAPPIHSPLPLHILPLPTVCNS